MIEAFELALEIIGAGSLAGFAWVGVQSWRDRRAAAREDWYEDSEIHSEQFFRSR